jgi:hypothetical protein
LRPKFDLILQRAGESPRLEFVQGAGKGSYHLRAVVDAKAFAQAVPEIMSSGSFLRAAYPGIGAGTATLDIEVNRADMTVSRFDYEMRLSAADGQVIVRSESTFSDYGKTVALPESRQLPLCAAYDDPPCKGTHLMGCNAVAPELSSPAIPPAACDLPGRRVCMFGGPCVLLCCSPWSSGSAPSFQTCPSRSHPASWPRAWT